MKKENNVCLLKLKMRILIIVPTFGIGGTIISLHSLLSLIGDKDWHVDVFARNASGEYLDKLPNCQILSENMFVSSGIYHRGCFYKILNLVFRSIRKVLRQIGVDITPLYCYLAGLNWKSKKYDVVISYQEDLTPLVCYIPAKKRIAWIHCDYSRYLKIIGKDEFKYFKRYNHIVCVSEYARKQFAISVPKVAERSVTIYNTINISSIIQKSQTNEALDPLYDSSCFTIISLGRIDPVKQFERIPQIASVIKANTDIPFRWYIIGGSRRYANVESEIDTNIKKCNVEKNVIRLQEKGNVYPYLLKSDLMVSTSSSEAFSLVVQEAKTLHIPVMINNFGVSSEIITEGVDGFICPIEEMGKKIATLMENQEYLKSVKETLKKNVYDNQVIISNIEKLIKS